jgi:hypothetical protein
MLIFGHAKGAKLASMVEQRYEWPLLDIDQGVDLTAAAFSQQ